jgi:hypothetical protein
MPTGFKEIDTLKLYKDRHFGNRESVNGKVESGNGWVQGFRFKVEGSRFKVEG